MMNWTCLCFAKNLQAQLAAGVEGIILGGTLGEASVLTTEEKEQLVKFAIREIKREGAGCNKYRRRFYERSFETG